MDFSEFQKRIAKFKKPICTCMQVGPDGQRCKNPPISSHSLQKSGALKSIAERGHVLSIQPTFRPGQVDWDFKKIGHSKASTFPGYCKKHDSELFAEIEDKYSKFGDRTAALLTLRGISREYFTKMAQIRLWKENEVQRPFTKQLGKSGYEEMIQNAETARLELEKAKSVVDNAIASNDYSNLRYTYVLHQAPLPFAFTGAFNPEYTTDGISVLPPADEEWGSIFAFCGSLGDNSVSLLSTVKGFGKGECGVFLDSVTDAHKSDPNFWLNLGTEYIENIFFLPSWVEKLTEIEKFSMISKFKVERSFLLGRAPDCLSELLIFPTS